MQKDTSQLWGLIKHPFLERIPYKKGVGWGLLILTVDYNQRKEQEGFRQELQFQ